MSEIVTPAELADELSARGVSLEALGEAAIIIAQRNPSQVEELTAQMGPLGPMVRMALAGGMFG